MTDTTAPAASSSWQDIALTLGKYALTLLIGAGGLWVGQKVLGPAEAKQAPPPSAVAVTISAEEFRKLACPATPKKVKVEGNLFGTASK